MRPYQDVTNREARGVEVPTDADDTRQAVAPRTSQHHAVARAKRRAAVRSRSMALTEIGYILDHHPTEKAGKMLWRAWGHMADGALSAAGSSDQRGGTATPLA
jgi:hypothetical protein